MPAMPSAIMLPVLLYLAFAVGIGVEYLIYGISLALPGSLAVVEWCEVEGVVAQQCVSEHKHVVNLLVATCDEACPVCFLAIVPALNDVHGGRTCLYPYELPVVVEVVCQKLSRLEGSVSEAALCGCYDGC